MLGLQRWKAGSLLAAWVAYWAALVSVSIGPGLLKAWRLARAPGSRGSMSASFDDGRLLLGVHDAGGAAGVWSFNTSMLTAIAWIAIPPLVLWVLWLVSRPRRGERYVADDPMLAAPPPELPMRGATSARTGAERVERPS